MKTAGEPDEIDAVISWVDGAGPRHAAKRESYSGQSEHATARAATRYADQGEIAYCLASILRFCPFVRRIFIVTDGQHPAALDDILAKRSEWRWKVEVVHHEAIYREHADLLPVFSSRSLETMIHRVPGLAERFIYLNDDIFIGRPLEPRHFFRAAKPVIRADPKPFPNPAIEWLKSTLARGPRRAGFKAAQQDAARLAGCRGTYLLAGHHPHAMRVSTMAAFFADRTALLRAQAGHRFRSVAQFSPIGLSNHLELARGAPVEGLQALGYVKPPRRARDRAAIAATLSALNRGELDALCVQSLDQMAEVDRRNIIAELQRWYFGESTARAEPT